VLQRSHPVAHKLATEAKKLAGRSGIRAFVIIRLRDHRHCVIIAALSRWTIYSSAPDTAAVLTPAATREVA
jgi:hypothetical protein